MGETRSKPLLEAIEEFCRRPDVAPKTRIFYRDPLIRVFLPWAEKRRVRDLADLTGDIVDDFARYLEGRRTKAGTPLATATRRAYLKALQQLLSWLARRYEVGANPKDVPLPSLRKKPRDVLSPPEVDRLEDAAAIERDKLIVRVMADTGAREGEVANLRVADLVVRDGRYHYLRLRGKTGERLAPIKPALFRRLRDYSEGKTGRPKTKSLFLFMAHRRRNGGTHEPLTPDGVYQALKDAAERADLGKRVYPHLLRHTAITQMVAAGMNLVTVSEIVGVSVTVIAQHYAHQTDEQRHEAMRRLWEGL